MENTYDRDVVRIDPAVTLPSAEGFIELDVDPETLPQSKISDKPKDA